MLLIPGFRIIALQAEKQVPENVESEAPITPWRSERRKKKGGNKVRKRGKTALLVKNPEQIAPGATIDSTGGRLWVVAALHGERRC